MRYYTFSKSVRILISLFLLSIPVFSQNTSEEDVKKEAQKYFLSGNYVSALPLYSQLLSFYAKDPLYNFRFGVCALEAGVDREKPIPYLEFASRNKEMSNDVFYYLGKAYHLNYRFSSALNAFNIFKQKASKADQEKFQLDRSIEMCRNGMELLKNISELLVMDKKELSLSDYFRAYDLSATGLKLLVKPDDFKTSLDLKKNEQSVVVMNPNQSEIFYSSYGENEKNGKDIYKLKRLSNGEWTDPIRLDNSVNTPFDEDFPYITPDGKTLYFCSKGHNSMGGYDVFRSSFNSASGTWGSAVNMDFAINTPDDDILYIPDEINKVAYFSSRRSSGQGNIQVYKILIGPQAPSIALISGVFSSTDENTHPEAVITVRDPQSKSIVGIFKTDPKTGNYSIALPKSGSYIFSIESETSPLKTETVVVPEKKDLGTLQQKITMKDGKLQVENIFDDTAINEANLMALLKEKAKLNVNYSSEKKQEVVEEKSSAMSNSDLLKIVFDDAKEIQSEANQLNAKADQAYALAKSKLDLANVKIGNADAIELKSKSISDKNLKALELTKANQLRKEAKLNTLEAAAIYEIAKNVEGDAKIKQMEAEESMNYAKELDNAVKINSQESIAKLSEKRNKLAESDTLSKPNKADKIYEDILEKAEDRQEQADAAQSRSKLIASEILDLDLKIENLEAERKSTTYVSSIKDLTAQIDGLKIQKLEKQKQLDKNYSDVAILQQEADDFKSQSNFVFAAMDGIKNQAGSLPIPTVQEKISLGNQLVVVLDRSNKESNVEKTPELQVNNSDLNNNPSSAFTTTKIGKSEKEDKTLNESVSSSAKNNEKANLPDEKNDSSGQDNQEITGQIADLKNKQTLTTDKKELAKIEKEIIALQNLEAEITPTPETELRTADSSLLVENEKSQEINDTAVKVISESKVEVKNELTIPKDSIPNEKEIAGEIVDSDALEESYDTEIEKLNGIADAKLKAESAQKLAIAWQQQINKKIDITNAQLDKAKNSEDIANLRFTMQSLQELQEKIDATTPIIAQPSDNLAAKTSEVNASNAKSLVLPKPVPLKTAESNFNNEQAKVQARKSDKIQMQLDELTLQTDSLTRLISITQDTLQKKKQEEKLKEIQKDITAKKIEVLKIYSVANNAEFNSNTESLKKAAAVNKDSDAENVSRAQMLVAEAAYYYNEASIKSETAKSISNTEAKEAALKKIVELEKTAIEKQLRALNTYGFESQKNEVAVQQMPSALIAQKTIVEVKDTLQKNNASNLTVKATAEISISNERSTNNTEIAIISQKDTAKITEKKNANESITFSIDTMKTNVALSKEQMENVVKSTSYKYYTKLMASYEENNQKSLFYEGRAQLMKKQAFQDSIKYAGLQLEASQTNDTLRKRNLLKEAAELLFQSSRNKQMSDSNAVVAAYYMQLTKENRSSADKYIERLNFNERNNLIAAVKMNAKLTANENDELTAVIPSDIVDAPESNSNNKVKENSNSNLVALELNDRNELVQEVVFKKERKAVYSSQNPIPINRVLPSGLIFKVQIGAFRKPIPQDLFNEFNPISGETTATGITRYTAGYFKTLNLANEARRDINNLGYKDAFVVAFCNGKRISIPEATILLRTGKTCSSEPILAEKVQVEKTIANEFESSTFASMAMKREQMQDKNDNNQNALITSGQTSAQQENDKKPVDTTVVVVIKKANETAVEVAPSVRFEEVNGLVYTVQVGVYSKRVMANQLYNIQPLFYETTAKGLFRYTSGIYNSLEIANKAKTEIVRIGVKDAFVISYLNGQKITVDEALTMEKQKGTSVFSNSSMMNKMPDINGNGTINIVKNTSKERNAATTETNIAAAEQTGKLVFKVQIGVFRSDVPLEIAAIFVKLATKGIDHYLSPDSLTIYTLGNFEDFNSTDALKNEAIAAGLKDAFVVAYRGGQKIKLEEAIKQANQK